MRGSSGTEDSDLPRIGTAAAPVTVRGGSGQRRGFSNAVGPGRALLELYAQVLRTCSVGGAGVLGGGGNGWEAGLSLKG